MTIIFDFDGTIADTTDNGIRIINEIAEEKGFKKLDTTKIDEYKKLSNKQLIKLAGVPFYRLPGLIKGYKKRVNMTIQNCKPYNGIPEMLDKLSKKFDLFILSSNSVENINKFLNANKLGKYFKNVFSESNLFGKHRAVNRVLKKLNLKKAEAIYIGDEVRDIEACKKAGIKIVSVPWGINAEEFIKSHNPDFFASTVEELSNKLLELGSN